MIYRKRYNEIFSRSFILLYTVDWFALKIEYLQFDVAAHFCNLLREMLLIDLFRLIFPSPFYKPVEWIGNFILASSELLFFYCEKRFFLLLNSEIKLMFICFSFIDTTRFLLILLLNKQEKKKRISKKGTNRINTTKLEVQCWLKKNEKKHRSHEHCRCFWRVYSIHGI